MSVAIHRHAGEVASAANEVGAIGSARSLCVTCEMRFFVVAEDFRDVDLLCDSDYGCDCDDCLKIINISIIYSFLFFTHLCFEFVQHVWRSSAANHVCLSLLQPDEVD